MMTRNNGTDLNIRMSCKTVTFAHPFRVPGIAGQQLAGSYEVETEEEPIAEVSYPAWRRRATTLRIESHDHGRPSVELVPVDPIWLGHALYEHQARSGNPDAPDRTAVPPGDRRPANPRPEKPQPIADWEDEGGAVRAT